MKRRKKVLIVLAALILLVAAPLLYGKWRLQRNYDELTAKATSLGIKLALPEPVHDAEAEVLRNKIKEFHERDLNYETLEISLDTDDPRHINIILSDIKEILPACFALSAEDSFGYDKGPSLQAIEALMFLNVVAKKSVIDLDLNAFLQTVAAIRKIAHLIDRTETISAGATAMFFEVYGGLLLQAADAFHRADQVSLLIAELNNWKVADFKLPASYLAAREFSYLDDDVATPTEGIVDKALRPIMSSKTAILEDKVSILRQAIDLLPRWADSRFILIATEKFDGEVSVPYFARFIKLCELEIRAMYASARAGLHARLLAVNKKPTPTIRELKELGIQTEDPVTGKQYEWRDFNGKPRLFGVIHRDEGPPVEGWLLLTERERRAERSP